MGKLKAKVSNRPGVLFRFELMGALEKLDDSDAGALFLGAMRYAQTGQKPMFENPLLLFAWELIRPAIDRDGQAYDEKIMQKRFAVYVREAKRAGQEPLSFDEWKAREHQPTSDDVGSYPIPSTTPNAIHTHIQEQVQRQGVAASPPTPARDDNGLILLSDAEYNQLREDLGENELARVISYLSGYCRLHGKSYTDWPFAIRKASKEGWGLKSVGQASAPVTDFQPSAERIQKNNEWLDSFLAAPQKEEGGTDGE